VITDAIFSFFAGLLHVALGWLPDPSPPHISGLVGDVASMWRYLGWANQYVPLTEALAYVTIMVTVGGAMWVARAVLYFFTKIHVLGGSSD
jgi:hypothetical protein